MNWRLLQGDAIEQLRTLPDESVHCVVTSPPYYGLRDYGTGIWEGGDPGCEHRHTNARPDHSGGRGVILDTRGTQPSAAAAATPMRGTCTRCGAVRRDQQIGLEATLAEYVACLVEVFEEVRRVLRSDGTLWLNLGDSYASKPRGSDEGWSTSRLSNPGRLQKAQAASLRRGRRTRGENAKEKDLLMVPATVALALREAGWWLRKEVIWHKRSPMPENVHDRPASSHEKLYLLAKSKSYFYDAEAVRESDAGFTAGNGFRREERLSFQTNGESRESAAKWQPGGGRHLRDVLSIEDDEWSAFLAWREWIATADEPADVWTLSSEPYPMAHFATFPSKLVEPCILAGTSEHGVCRECGAPWRRQVESSVDESRGRARVKPLKPGVTSAGEGRNGRNSATFGHRVQRRTVGWEPTCEHDAPGGAPLVLDPFAGACTTAVVALAHGRDFVGVELNPEYVELGRRRIIDKHGLVAAAGEAA